MRIRDGIAAVFAALAFGTLSTPTDAQVRSPGAFPSFLPSWFAPALDPAADHLGLATLEQTNGVDRTIYESGDKRLRLTIQHTACQPQVCDALMGTAVQLANQTATAARGGFTRLASDSFDVSWFVETERHRLLTWRLPRSILSWSYETTAGLEPPSARIARLPDLVARLTFEAAASLDNVERGRWTARFRDLAGAYRHGSQ